MGRLFADDGQAGDELRQPLRQHYLRFTIGDGHQIVFALFHNVARRQLAVARQDCRSGDAAKQRLHLGVQTVGRHER